MAFQETAPKLASQTGARSAAVGSVRYRPALPGDIPAMTDVFLKAVSDLYVRNNVPAAVPPRPAVLAAYEHVRATGIFYVAERDSEIIAIAGAILRGDVWYLSAFWALPDRQRQGVGMPLLRQVWRLGAEAGATRFFTWSSIDPTAMAAYMKLGMVPGTQILQFEGIPKGLEAVPAGYQLVDLERTVAVDLDEEIAAIHRPVDHDFWNTQAGLLGRQVVRDGQVVGYYYLGRGGIGPAAWRKREDAKSVLTVAVGEAGESGASVRLAIPGLNHVALGFALDAGLRLTGFAHLLTSRPFGQMDRYVPSGPSLF